MTRDTASGTPRLLRPIGLHSPDQEPPDLPAAGGRMDEGFSIDLRREVGGNLHAHVRGEASLANTVAYWQAILVEVAIHKPRYLLLVDELRGAPLLADEWQALVNAIAGRGLDGVRIAHVKPAGLERIEHCEIFATEAGLEARVFVDEYAANVWLHYGASQAS